MTKVKQKDGNKTKETFCHEKYSNMTSLTFHEKILMYFKDFQNQNFSAL